MKNDTKEVVLKYLRTQYVMGVATSDKKGNLWPATVYYIVDDDLNIYFMSSPKTIHAQNIRVSSEVALIVADSDQNMSGDQIGIQISGICTRVRGVSHVKNLVDAYKKSKLKVGSLTFVAFKKAATSGIYKVTPKKIKYFNTKLYPKDKFIEFEI